MQLNLGQNSQPIQASTEIRNTDSPTQQLSWGFRTPQVSESLSGSFGLSRSRGSDRLNANFSYTGYRAIWNLAPDIAFTPTSTQANALVSVRTAIAFADGNIAFSRPISDSVALVVPEKALASQIVGINPDGQGTYLSRADGVGAAVVPNLSSYVVSRLLLEVPDAPAGIETGNPVYYALPTYKSGTVIRVGTEATVYIRGVLTDEKGTVIFSCSQSKVCYYSIEIARLLVLTTFASCWSPYHTVITIIAAIGRILSKHYL
jgi:outer membrane usher protein